jgi:hypothetical protein
MTRTLLKNIWNPLVISSPFDGGGLRWGWTKQFARRGVSIGESVFTWEFNPFKIIISFGY